MPSLEEMLTNVTSCTPCSVQHQLGIQTSTSMPHHSSVFAKHCYSSACLPSVDAYLILSGTFRPGTSCTRHCPWLLHVLEIQTICMVNPWPTANIRATSQRAVTRKAGRVGMNGIQCACVYRPSRLGVETGLT